MICEQYSNNILMQTIIISDTGTSFLKGNKLILEAVEYLLNALTIFSVSWDDAYFLPYKWCGNNMMQRKHSGS